MQVAKAAPVATAKERHEQQLKEAEEGLKSKPDDADLRLNRAVAYFYLGETEKALPDLSWFIGKQPKEADGYLYRAIAFARLGQVKEAKADRTKFQELSSDASMKVYLDALVLVYLGEDAEATKHLETALLKHPKETDWLYNAARAYALTSLAVSAKDEPKSKAYVERAVALVKEAMANNDTNYERLQTDRDLDSVRQNMAFLDLLKEARADRRYVAVWHAGVPFSSTEVHGLEPVEHQARCKALMAQGYRPASLSVAEIETGRPLIAASVWQRPLVVEEDKEKLAKRQANAAVGLLRMGQADGVWPLLKHSPDPRVRSYLINRLGPLGADPHTILSRFDEEKELSIRRALLLSLGEFTLEQLSPADRNRVLAQLLEGYRQENDPGLHGALEWLLRQWKQEDKLKEIERQLAKARDQKVERKPHWYINHEGQTMVVLPGPVEFLMGSPSSTSRTVCRMSNCIGGGSGAPSQLPPSR